MYYHLTNGTGVWQDYNEEKLICVYIEPNSVLSVGHFCSRKTFNVYAIEFQSESLDEMLGYIALGKL